MGKRHYCDNSHLTLQERITIQQGIENGAKKVDIARTIGKDPTTIAKEIRKHRSFTKGNMYGRITLCVHRRVCNGCNKIDNRCEKYQELGCKRRDRSPGACNNCNAKKNCYLDKYFYNASKANGEYLKELSESRGNVHLDEDALKELALILKPLLVDKNQSVYQALQAHPEIEVGQRTIYSYIEQQLLKEYGIDNFSLKRKVQRKPSKKKNGVKRESINRENRRYSDYLKFIEENPDLSTTEMDTLYNSQSGPYVQTFMFNNTKAMIGFIHKEKTAESMSRTLDKLELSLGAEDFDALFGLTITDRGPEFGSPELFEYSKVTGKKRLELFYCDPRQSQQKPHVENNHNYVRELIPNNTVLDNLTNEDLEFVFNNINNTPRKSLGGKTPYETFLFIYGEEVCEKLGIKKIDPDKVDLSPLAKLKKKK